MKEEKSLLEIRFDRFVAAVHAAIEEHKNEIQFANRTVAFVFDDAALDHLYEILIDGVFYSLRDDMANKVKLAVAGLLGDDVVEAGRKKMFILQQRASDERRKAKYAELVALWGQPYAKKLWDNRTPNRDRPRIAKATTQLIAKAAEHGHIPASIKEVKSWGLQLPRLNNAEWDAVKELAVFLTKMNIQ